MQRRRVSLVWAVNSYPHAETQGQFGLGSGPRDWVWPMDCHVRRAQDGFQRYVHIPHPLLLFAGVEYLDKKSTLKLMVVSK